MIGPEARHLDTVAAGDVEREDTREGEEIVGGGLTRLDWTRVTLRGCLVRLVDVTDLELGRARLVDSRLAEPDVVHLDATDSMWRSVEVTRGRLGAWDMAGGFWDSVSVVGARIGYANMRDATLTDVHLHDCRIETLDLAGATVRRMSLHGCVIGELVVNRAELIGVDLRGADLARIDGVQSLGGATISAEQLLGLAPALAREAGISVGPWPL